MGITPQNTKADLLVEEKEVEKAEKPLSLAADKHISLAAESKKFVEAQKSSSNKRVPPKAEEPKKKKKSWLGGIFSKKPKKAKKADKAQVSRRSFVDHAIITIYNMSHNFHKTFITWHNII